MTKYTQFFLVLALLVSTIFWSNISLAEDRYVSDVMYIPLRKLPGNQQDVIVNGIASGTLLEFIREETDSNKTSWTLVKTAEGILGWARTQHLLSEPPAAVQLQFLQNKYNDLLKDIENLNKTSVSSINFEQENQQLHEKYQLLQTRADFLQAENDQLKNTDRYNQWVYGGGLLICGVLLSFFLQAFGKRKRHTEWR